MVKKVMSKSLVFVIIGLFIGASVVPISCANEKNTDVYVNNDYTGDLCDGTWEHPYKTITQGIENASYGDTVKVCNGTYNENIFIQYKSLTLMRSDRFYPGDKDNDLIIDGGGKGHVIRIEDVENDGVKIEKFKIQNSGKRDYDAGIYISGSNDSKIIDNNLSNNGNGIIIIYSNSININGNKLYNNLLDGIQISHCYNFKIDNNKIYNCGQIHINPSPNYGNGIKIANSNSIYITNNDINEATSGISVTCESSASDIVIQKNNVSECYHNGICIKQYSAVRCTENNIFSNGLLLPLLGAGIYLYTVVRVKNFSIQNNYIHNNQYNIVISYSWITPGQIRHNNITKPNSTQFYVGGSYVNADHNYWGRENLLPFNERKLIWAIVWTFPYSDHPWSW